MNFILNAHKKFLKKKSSENTTSKCPTCESKFVAHSTVKDMAHAILMQHCFLDDPYPFGIIESIYFDDHKFSAYMEKRNGDSFKCKVRIRWYSNSLVNQKGQIKAYLEIKNRIGSARFKRRHSFFVDKMLLCNSALGDPKIVHLLYEQAAIAGFSIPFGFIPSINVVYHRHRFICRITGTRVNLDSMLESNRVNKDLIPLGERIHSESIVCESKSSVHKFWGWNDSLFRLGFRRQSFSKYGEFMNAQINKGT